jgi:hypothetical protein
MTEVTERKSRFSVKWLVIGCSVLFLGIVVLALLAFGVFVRPLFITIGPDEVAVLITPYESNGYSEMPLTPGNHMLRPGERAEIFKFTREVYVSSTDDCNCGSTGAVTFRANDGVEIIINYQVTYAINSEQVVNLFREWRHDYRNGFVIPQSKKIIKEIASQYPSGEIALTKKNEIEQAIFSRLESEFSKTYLILFEFKIDDVRLNQ